MSVFSLSEGDAFDIRCMAEEGGTPLGVYCPEGCDSLTLHFAGEGGLDVADYRLLDRATGALWELDAPVVLRKAGSSAGRYVVVASDYEPAPAPVAEEVYVELQGGTATVHSAGAGIAQVSAYATDGRCTAVADAHGAQQASLPLSQGVHILQVRLADGATRSFKMLVRN